MQEDDRQLVIQALGSLPAERFAVVDGAHFDDLPKELDIWKLEHKALYLEKLGETPSTAGPYLVSLTDWEAANRVLSLVGELPAAVFWSWGDGQPSLYKHLRRINMIEIPEDNYNPEQPKYDRVLLRHADPNVMSGMLSVLDEGQFSQVLGGAAGLVMFARDEGGLRVAQRISEMGSDRQGILRLSVEQIELMDRRNSEISRRAIMAYLRDSANEETSNLDDVVLYKQICDAEKVGSELGIETEEAHGLFAYLAVTTGGKSLQEPRIKNAFKKSSTSGDRTMIDLFDSMIDAAKKDVQ